jgi:small multidrug resistance family-3 protein
MTGRSIALFVAAAICEIGGAYLMWQAVKEGRGLLFALAGAVALIGYGVVAALQPEPHFGRVLAAYGGVFIAGSLLWGIIFDGFRPDRYDLTGAGVALVGVAIIMYAPR